MWPCPKEVPWTGVAPLTSVVSFAAPADPTDQYASLWRSKEQQAAQDLPQVWLPSMQGRAQQLAPRRCCTPHAPITQGRSHDVQPEFLGFSTMHARQFKQLRRLQNYCRWAVNHEQQDKADPTHGIRLWNAILRAPGFVPSFAQWWLSRQYVSPLDPVVLPELRPSAEVAHQVFEAVQAEVRLLESKLQQARTSHRVHRHVTDTHLIFREVARCPAEPVESLLHSVHAEVAEVDEDQCAAVLSKTVELKPEIPVWIAGNPYEIVHSEADKVWLTDVSLLASGQSVSQSQFVGDLPALFEAFHDQWKLRWCRHDSTAFNRWDMLLDFAKAVIRPLPIPHLEVDVPLARAEFHRKKKWAATGLDGVSRHDWILADDVTVASLLSAFRRAESDGEWPAQLLAGKVHSLAKSEGASSVGDYRPITVFGLGYRAWSSLHSRHLLQWAEQWVDDGVFGNRKGRQAADLWHHVMLQIELAYTSDTPLTGLSADIEKCFNCIPRFPALCLAVLVGTPAAVTTAWAGALTAMRRHFKVRDSFSDGFATSTGLAEGCGLSVYGMLLVDHLFSLWMRHQASPIQTLSYVDDWQSLTWSPDYAVRQLALVEQFAQLLDLTVDRRKTFGWSTHPSGRQQLRAIGVHVLHHARELGGHLGISRQHTNHTLAQRIQALDDLWAKLRASRAKHPTKVRVLKTVAWPRGLHAITSAPVGDSVWVALRRKAVSALGLQKPGINGFVLLGLVEPLADPQLVGLLWTCRSVRQQCPVDFWETSVALVASGRLTLPPNSLASIVASRLRQVGLVVLPTGEVRDEFGTFHVHVTNYAEVELRLQWAWQRVVSQRVSHRTEFGGLWQADAPATRRSLACLALDDQAMYRQALAGGLFTESYKAKWTSQSDACRWCGQPDTTHHRFWTCPQHADLRSSLAPGAVEVLDSLPPALALRGWPLLPPTWHAWIRLLVSLPNEVPEPSVPLAPGVWHDVFTDGSCLHQAQPMYRVAAWSAVCVPPLGASLSFGGSSVLGASFLPGLCQNAFRAELYAIAFSVHCAARARAPIRLWTDCKGVVIRYHQLFHGDHKLAVNRANSDLWGWLGLSLDILGKDQVQIRKVPAHRCLQSACSRHEAWMIFNNGLADKAARVANQARPAGFWQIWEDHVQATSAAEVLSTQVRELHLAVGRRNVLAPGDVEETAPAVRETRVFLPTFDRGDWQQGPLPGVTRLFGADHVQRATAWFFARLESGSAQSPIWVSFVQLFIDYQLTWGNPGPLRVQGQWVDQATRKYLDAEKFPFRQRVRWFRLFLKHFWKETRVSPGLEQCRPASEHLQTFLPGAALPWCRSALFQVDRWLAANLAEPCVRDGAALQSLPLIRADKAMQLGT